MHGAGGRPTSGRRLDLVDRWCPGSQQVRIRVRVKFGLGVRSQPRCERRAVRFSVVSGEPFSWGVASFSRRVVDRRCSQVARDGWCNSRWGAGCGGARIVPCFPFASLRSGTPGEIANVRRRTLSNSLLSRGSRELDNSSARFWGADRSRQKCERWTMGDPVQDRLRKPPIR